MSFILSGYGAPPTAVVTHRIVIDLSMRISETINDKERLLQEIAKLESRLESLEKGNDHDSPLIPGGQAK